MFLIYYNILIVNKGVNFMKKAMLFCILLYQKHISILKSPCCRFYPSCSNYAFIAISRFGFLKGFVLFLIRFLKCNPFFKGGIDYPPLKFRMFCKNNMEDKKWQVYLNCLANH